MYPQEVPKANGLLACGAAFFVCPIAYLLSFCFQVLGSLIVSGYVTDMSYTADQSREVFTAVLLWLHETNRCEQRSRRDQVLDCVFCKLKKPNFEHLLFDLIMSTLGELNLGQ